MFTGIVEGIGTIREISDSERRSATRITVDLGSHSEGLQAGQSVALNGVCLTAVDLSGTECVFEMIEETVNKTDLGNLDVGGVVNIERSLKVGDRLEGHFVLGHVDGVGVIQEIDKKPDEVSVSIKIPQALSRYIVQKGSVAVDGISLTVVDIRDNVVSVSLIPHTIDVTNFHTRKPGDRVNIETDILGKYIMK